MFALLTGISVLLFHPTPSCAKTCYMNYVKIHGILISGGMMKGFRKFMDVLLADSSENS